MSPALLLLGGIQHLQLAAHLAILFADRGEFDRRDRRIKSLISGMSDIGDFIRRSGKIEIAALDTPGNFLRSLRLA